MRCKMKLRFFLISCILFFFLNAQTAIAPVAGDGTVGNPYRISNLGNLYWIATDTAHWSEYYIQTDDIDASETQTWFSTGSGEYRGWRPLGFIQYYFIWNGADSVWQIDGQTYRPFSGTYDGNDFTISGLYINRDSSITEMYGQPTGIDSAQYIGLFGILDGATIENLVCQDFNITGKEEVGGLAGNAISSEIRNCHISGTVTGYSGVGGLLGYNRGSLIETCSADIIVTGNHLTGGLAGTLLGSDAVTLKCGCIGEVRGMNMTGGLTGRNDHGSISNCYSLCSVEGGDYTGGLAGFDDFNSTISKSYSAGPVSGSGNTGGLVGYLLESVPNTNILWCFWDIQTSGLQTSAGGNGKTTSEMRDRFLYADNGWDLNTIWDIRSYVNGGYPYLRTLAIPEVCHVCFEVNMSTCEILNPVSDTVRITGSFFDWAIPGTSDEQEMVRDGESDLWVIDMVMDSGTYEYKYFYNSGWENGEWNGGANRGVNITSDTIFHNVWGSPTDELPSGVLSGDLPDNFILAQPYPNPFNPETVISYHLPADGWVDLSIFNSRGQRVATLVSGDQTAGSHSFSWDASVMSSGIYIIRAMAGGNLCTQKIALVK